MKIFLDTADTEDIKEANEIIDGVTTNPSLLKAMAGKQGFQDLKRYLKDLFKLLGEHRHLSLQITESGYEAMKIETDKMIKLFGKYKNLVIKIPVNSSQETSFDSLKLIKELSAKNVKVNATLIMKPEQAILAAKAGAFYVSPFAGRIDDNIRNKSGMSVGRDYEKDDYFSAEGLVDKSGEEYDDHGIVSGVDLVWKIKEIFKNYKMTCQILASSARNSRQVREFALAGADVASVPMNVLKEMTAHEMTAQGISKFAEDVPADYKELFKDKRKFAINLTKD